MTAVTRLRRQAADDYMESTHTVWLSIAALVVDSAVNTRPLDERRAQRIADNFDPDAVGVIHVSIRPDGSHVILDGAHRVAAMRLLGWTDQRIECKTYTGLNKAQEARLFSGLNDSVRVQAIPRFLARCTANEPVATHIQNILADNDWRVAVGQVAGCFMAVSAAETVYKGDRGKPESDGPTALAATVRTVTEAWGHDPAAVNAYVIRGLGLVYTRHPELDRNAMVRKLAAYPGGPTALVGAGKGLHSYRGGTLPHAVAEVIVELYNKKRSASKLPDWRS